MEFKFFTKEEGFGEWYGNEYHHLKRSGSLVIGSHRRKVKDYFFFRKINSIIAVNLSGIKKEFKTEDKIMKAIFKCIDHEYIHEVLDEIGIGDLQHHWATKKLGLNYS